MEDNDDSDIERKIEREVYKTKNQKMEDFINHAPNVVMKNGETNDVIQAIL